MRSIDPNAFASAFATEADLRGAVAGRLANSKEVKITQGSQEYGRDIVFRTQGSLLESSLCGCVVKQSRISGAVDSNQGAITVLHQGKQCLTHLYLTKGRTI
jgi:hypothetical protein